MPRWEQLNVNVIRYIRRDNILLEKINASMLWYNYT